MKPNFTFPAKFVNLKLRKNNIKVFTDRLILSLFSILFLLKIGVYDTYGWTLLNDEEPKALSCREVYVSIKQKRVTRTVFIHAEKVYINFVGMTGFVEDNGKVALGLSLKVLDSNKKELYFQEDIFSSYLEVDTSSITRFGSFFSAAYPYQDNEKYTVHIKVWDKKGDRTYQFKMPFTIKGNKHVRTISEYCRYETIGLFDPLYRDVITDNIISDRSTFQLYIQGIANFKVLDGRIYPAMSMKFVDDQGYIQEADNVLLSVKESGIDAEVFARYFSANITLESDDRNDRKESPGVLTINLYDTRSKAKIEITTDITLKK